MSEVAYIKKRFSDSSLDIIVAARQICEEYARQGYDLTLRQLYYQFVSRDLIPNTQRDYKRLGSIINDARLAGVLDWDYIVDRTRNVEIPSSWGGPAEIVDAAAQSYYIDRWQDQLYRPEVWVEKDALGGVIERACGLHRVPWFSCRGYTSQSEIWGAAQRLRGYLEQGQIPVILHLGDHDPSGIDMTRDILDRLELFLYRDWVDRDVRRQIPTEDGKYPLSVIRGDMARRIKHTRSFNLEVDTEFDTDRELPVWVRRIALNMDQVEEYDPPPNPAKFTDSRARDYVEIYGRESWELDALEPTVLSDLIQDNIEDLIERDEWNKKLAREERGRSQLLDVARRFKEEGLEEEE